MSYREALERVKKLENSPEEVPTKPSKGAFVGSEGRSQGENSKIRHDWKEVFPELDPEQWRVTVLADGSIHGRKVRGQLKGTISFLIPADWKPAPTTAEPLQEKWTYSTVTHAGTRWRVARRSDGEEIATRISKPETTKGGEKK